ncbi:tRNA-splicing endonuclease subunit Sen2 [Helicoverpa zea]|uniref:tRNA-splicing endonuclease subunit Sen2 n=1 Tax=Helicoverpa zea TaxID=7113 RepID=UPI001F57E656|nr:tRNA-splicing endonuclease subunit Sen2 [Helicoverpa zea]XP_047031586.1 tRNA-splicing endonuclease subunit Sen2 [Helicoverpa zea]XP_047031587.1 tRNA-splicing endonuclease subunit Sen2 [Helicoverpa zea]XP_047031588.1 tRNA-splicing endonuclease subunit Sen2 [Helicoverpa zea]XP_047031589.1 tRNA-splicing endonuclease subunit Sen2 [Helicoverpa zea]XP_047031590.1 tRNA-splicing endonuclease subunit Sen2 [Helicoverpa zea]
MTTLQSEDCQTNDLNDSFPMAIESLRFPLDNSMRIVFTGYYNGFNVEVRSVEEIALLYHMGCFGKGSASRSQPKAAQNDVTPRIMRKRQFLKRNYWFKKFGGFKGTAEADNFMKDVEGLTAKIIGDGEKRTQKDVIDLVSSDEDDGTETNSTHSSERFQNHDKEDIVVIVPNSESEEENYFANMKPKCCLNKVKIQEKLMLTPQEAFFLLYGLGCLQIVSLDNTLLNIEKCWDIFTTADSKFVNKYVVYHYYRSKGYVVKPGIKFGGDYLLYKEGPGISHADNIVVIKSSYKEDDWVSILGHVRMANTTVKEILIVEVIRPTESVKLPEDLKLFSIRELLLSRNLPVVINEDD